MEFQNLIDAFVFNCSIERRLASNTTRAYTSDLGHFVGFAGSEALRDGITTDLLRSYLAQMLGEMELSIATVRRRVACLKAFCAFVAAQTDMPDPFEDWSPTLKRPKRLPRALSRSEIRCLVKPSIPLTAIQLETVFSVLLFSATGLRVSELCNIRVSDVVVDGGAIQITGKGARDRIVYISDKQLRQLLVRRRTLAEGLNGGQAWLFTNSRGAQLKPQTLRRRLHELASRLDLNKKITPHMLRHTAATLLVESGVDIRFVQRLLGHASIATTEIYTHVSDASLKRAMCTANVVGDLMGSDFAGQVN